MNDFGFNDYNALFQRMYGPKPEKDKAGWLDPALTAAGAIAGTMLMPGAGMAAGASLGRAAGGAAHSAVNGNAQGAMEGAMGLPALWQQFAPYIGTFAEGGPVPEIEQTDEYGNPIAPQAQGQPKQALSMLTPELIAQLQQHAQTLAGPAPTAPTATPLRQSSHPTLEALATLMPTLLGSLPKPANPKNTKAIGAWAPFAGNALAAPALIAQSRRKSANAPIEDANTQAQSDYEARQKAYEDQKKAYGTALIQGAMRPQGQGAQVGGDDRPMTEAEALRITKDKGWTGYSLRQYRAWSDGQPKPDKPQGVSPRDELGIVNTISDNMRQDKDIQNFVVVRDNYNRISDSARRGNGISDMSLIFAYMKVLDPTSVVRESEYKNAAQAIGLIPQLANTPANWFRGDKLTPAGRAGFVAAARNLYNQQLVSYRRAVAKYSGQAKRFGVDPALILQDLESPEAAQGAQEQPFVNPFALKKPTSNALRIQ